MASKNFLPQELPVLHYEKQYMQNSKIARVLSKTDYEIDTEENGRTKFRIPVGAEIVNFVDLWMDEHIELSSYNINQFDMAVMDAIYTIDKTIPRDEYGRRIKDCIFPVEWIVKVLTGNSNIKVTDKQVKSVKESIRKLRNIHITINSAEEQFQRNIMNSRLKMDDFLYSSGFLSVGEIRATYKINGKRVTAYKLLETPPLYDYAEAIHQIVCVSPELFLTQDKFNDSTDAILIKRYVIRRVAQIINPRNRLNSDKISYLWYDHKSPDERERGLFPELGYDPTGDNTYDEYGNPLTELEKEKHADNFRRKIKPKIKNIVEGTLQTLVEQKVIQGFIPYREGNSKKSSAPVMGYQIIWERPEIKNTEDGD